MNYDMAMEMVKSHNRRAAILWSRAERTMSVAARAAIMLAANTEQMAAVRWTAEARVYRPLPVTA